MASRSNPNTPSSLKKKTAGRLKSKRKHTQRVVAKRRVTNKGAVGKVETGNIGGTSQAIRKEEGRRRRKVEAERKAQGKKKVDGDKMEVEQAGNEENMEGTAGMDVD